MIGGSIGLPGAAGQSGEAMRAHALDDRHAENQQHERHREATTHQHVAEHILEDTCRSSQNQHRMATASIAAPQWPDRENQPTQEGGIPAPKVPLTGSNSQNRTEIQIEHPSTMSPASNTSKEA